MSKQQSHINRIISLENLIKYIKGNLLGDKKKDIEVGINASPLMQDAAEGIKEFKKPEKLADTVDELNKMIALKIGSQVPIANTDNRVRTSSSSHKIASLNLKAIAAIGAAASVIILLGVGLYFVVENNSNKRNEHMVSKEDLVPAESKQAPTSYKEFIAQDTNKIDSNNVADTLTLATDDQIPVPTLKSLDLADQQVEDDFQSQSDFKPEERKRIVPNVPKAISPVLNETENNEAEKEEISEERYGGASNNSNRQLTNTGIESTEKAPINKDKKARSESNSGSYNSKSGSYEIPNDEAAYKLGLEYAKNKSQYDLAIKQFEIVIDNKKSTYYDDAAWQLANIYIKQEESRKAKKLLRKIQDSNKYGEQATKLLDTL